jgi:AcrR family transcriptional regulator
MKKPRQKPRIRNPAQTRARLLQATIGLVAEKGDDALSVKEAARAANVSRGAAYQHFEDRDHLLREAKTWIADRLAEAVGVFNSAPLELQVSQVVDLVLGNREAARLLVADCLAGKGIEADHPLYRRLLQCLEDFKASGDARTDIDVDVMSYIMLGSVASMVMLSRPREGIDIADLSRRYTAEWTRILRQGIFALEKPVERINARAAPAPPPPPRARRKKP